jgi:hypothetical protein
MKDNISAGFASFGDTPLLGESGDVAFIIKCYQEVILWRSG